MISKVIKLESGEKLLILEIDNELVAIPNVEEIDTKYNSMDDREKEITDLYYEFKD